MMFLKSCMTGVGLALRDKNTVFGVVENYIAFVTSYIH